jgi:hypothetical protein
VASSTSIKVFPNPVVSNIIIHTKIAGGSLAIYNSAGVMLHAQTINSDQTIVNISKYAAGVYYARINTKDAMTSIKFIKE